MAPELTKRQRIAHLLRRFGLGARESDLDRLEPLDVDGTLDYLLNYEKVPEEFYINPWMICSDFQGSDVYVDGFRFAAWWALRMIMSQHPAEQRMTLFWHNHFAVSGEKVDFGPIMLGYLETIRANALGPFPSLLKAVSKEPAMLRYLDGDTSVRNHPNENFARELMELFTLGKGAYSEDDVQEASRAMTGWNNRYTLYEDPNPDLQAKMKRWISRDQPMASSYFNPAQFDPGLKSVLGKRQAFDADQLLDYLADRPETARHITGKLWRYFACDDMPESVAGHLASVYLKSGGSIKEVLTAIAHTREFWSERCVRRQVKSPADFVVPIIRQFELQPMLINACVPNATRLTPLPQQQRDIADLVFASLYKQGMILLYPPNVGGWPSGTQWISQNNMLARVQFADTIFGVDQVQHALALYLAKHILDGNPITSYNVVVRLMSIFDADLPPRKQYLLVQAFEHAGGVKSLHTGPGAGKSLAAVCRLLFGSPEFQLC